MNEQTQGVSSARRACIRRETRETRIELELALDGTGAAQVETGLGFLDHMLKTLAKHACFDLQLSCAGDLRVDDHHSVEDCALALGQALDAALEDRRGIARFGWAYAPMDEALVRAVVDFSGRSACAVSLALERERVGDVACENVLHFFRSLAATARAAVHIDAIRGENDHHRIEAAFKALALALRQAAAQDNASDDVPSVKGSL